MPSKKRARERRRLMEQATVQIDSWIKSGAITPEEFYERVVASIERHGNVQRLPGESILSVFARACDLTVQQVEEFMKCLKAGEDPVTAEQRIRRGE